MYKAVGGAGTHAHAHAAPHERPHQQTPSRAPRSTACCTLANKRHLHARERTASSARCRVFFPTCAVVRAPTFRPSSRVAILFTLRCRPLGWTLFSTLWTTWHAHAPAGRGEGRRRHRRARHTYTGSTGGSPRRAARLPLQPSAGLPSPCPHGRPRRPQRSTRTQVTAVAGLPLLVAAPAALTATAPPSPRAATTTPPPSVGGGPPSTVEQGARGRRRRAHPPPRWRQVTGPNGRWRWTRRWPRAVPRVAAAAVAVGAGGGRHHSHFGRPSLRGTRRSPRPQRAVPPSCPANAHTVGRPRPASGAPAAGSPRPETAADAGATAAPPRCPTPSATRVASSTGGGGSQRLPRPRREKR